MKKTRSEKLKLGAFMTIGLLIFIVAIYFIGQRQNLFAKTFLLSSNFTNVNGLVPGNNVRYSGINVGTVKRIQMVNDSVIHVEMVIDEKMTNHIKTDAIATIGTDGLVGNVIVNIIPGDSGKTTVNDGSFIASYTKIGTDEMLNTLSSTNENAALLISKLLNITNEITDGKGTLGMLITDSTLSQNLKETVNYLKRTSVEAHKSVKELNKLILSVNFDNSVAGVILNDTIEAQNVRKIIANLNKSTDDIKIVMDNLNATLEQLKNGEGVINYLSTDKELVNQLQEIMFNIDEGTTKFNENMEALKHSVLTRGYFRKLEKEKRKAEEEKKN
ncbi:MCE family protein [Winogradskyella sp. DF17]|uniref:MCE family protein n=2 Tax=Winogradskyella pelagia TaxID=2819984 RepID=A0ABS3T5W6_9FLAO|nr:MCE family protein [Winogradskyella sp. DF17]